MKSLPLYNTAHPLADTGKPIFIPFGEWKYDATRRQRLDRAHGERIANELNARVARGEPGIPVYQGHPDVPELASKYPDKGALGWVTKIELANESRPDGRTVSGLNLTVEWDRDPGKGFKWFSPYWFANEVERDGVTYIVSEISSIGLVNNPNIPEFRLANEEQTMKTNKLNPAIIELAAKYDRLANEANFDESKHPRANDGKFTSGGGGSSGGVKGLEWKDSEGVTNSKRFSFVNYAKMGSAAISSKSSRGEKAKEINGLIAYTREERKGARAASEELFGPESRDDATRRRRAGRAQVKGLHVAAIRAGLTYNRTTHQYE